MLKLKLAFSFLVVTLLAGCGHHAIDTRQKALMPKAAAEKIIATYFGQEWLAAPYLIMGGPRWCEGEKKSISIASINGAVTVGGMLTITNEGEFKLKMGGSCTYVYRVNVGNEANLRDVGSALSVLGAPLDQIYWAM